MTSAEYERAMAEAQGDADTMLGAASMRIRSLERELAAGRPLTEDLRGKFRHLAIAMSPENLSRDGELSPARARAAHARLSREWGELEALAGRKVTQDEILDDSPIAEWAGPVAARIADFAADLDHEDRDMLRRALVRAFRSDPEALRPLIGTGVIEESYFDGPKEGVIRRQAQACAGEGISPEAAPGHTPAPWFIQVTRAGEDTFHHHVMAHAADDGRHVEVCRVFPISDDGQPGAESARNATLIACAPGLLEALRKAVSAEVVRLEGANLSTERSPWVRIARSAIAEASGESGPWRQPRIARDDEPEATMRP